MLLRLVRSNGVREGFALWRIWRRVNAALSSRAYLDSLGPEYHTHHGRRADLPGWRRR